MVHLALTIFLTAAIIFLVLQVMSWRMNKKRKKLASLHAAQWRQRRSVD